MKIWLGREDYSGILPSPLRGRALHVLDCSRQSSRTSYGSSPPGSDCIALFHLSIYCEINAAFYMAGPAGFEPAHDGIKTRCLTAWRRPNKRCYSSSLPPGGLLRASLHYALRAVLARSKSFLTILYSGYPCPHPFGASGKAPLFKFVPDKFIEPAHNGIDIP